MLMHGAGGKHHVPSQGCWTCSRSLGVLAGRSTRILAWVRLRVFIFGNLFWLSNLPILYCCIQKYVSSMHPIACQQEDTLMQGMACINAISYRVGPHLLSGVGSLTIVACVGIIITQHAQLSHYLGMLTHQAAIESKFIDNLTDNLNAEIVLGAPWMHTNGPFLA